MSSLHVEGEKVSGKATLEYKNDEKERKWLLVFDAHGMRRGGTRCDLVSFCRCHSRFLSAEYRAELEELVHSFLPEAPLWVAVNERDRPVGFMLLSGQHMDALFIDLMCAAAAWVGCW